MMASFVEYRRSALSRQALLHGFDLPRKLGVELGHLLILRSESSRLFEELVSCFPEVGDFPLESFALRCEGFELFAILLFDGIEAISEGDGNIASFPDLCSRAV